MKPWFLLVALVATNAAAEDPQIRAVRFQLCAAKQTCTPIERWTETTPGSAPSKIRVIAEVKNTANLEDDYFILTTTQYMVTPLYAFSAADVPKLRAGGQVSWSQLTRDDDDMRAYVLHKLQHDTLRMVPLRTLDLGSLLKKAFSDPEDCMWPWIVRVHVRLVDRAGNTMSSSSGDLDLLPSAPRLRCVPAK